MHTHPPHHLWPGKMSSPDLQWPLVKNTGVNYERNIKSKAQVQITTECSLTLNGPAKLYHAWVSDHIKYTSAHCYEHYVYTDFNFFIISMMNMHVLVMLSLLCQHMHSQVHKYT